jgi:hypothetical protein
MGIRSSMDIQILHLLSQHNMWRRVKNMVGCLFDKTGCAKNLAVSMQS